MPTLDYSYRKIKRPGLIKRLIGYLPLPLLRHIYFFRETGQWGNFRRPSTFGEKMQWRIINDRRTILRSSADRRANRSAISETARSNSVEIMMPELLAFSDHPQKLVQQLKTRQEQHSLPRKWLIKPNNSSGELLVTDGEPDWETIESRLNEWMSPGVLQSIHWLWANAMATPGFIAESWIGDADRAPEEWKIFVVGGEPSFYVINRRDSAGNARIHLDRSWNEMETWHHNAGGRITRESIEGSRDLMDSAARVIARDWDLLRVDLYWADGRVWFGELTPYPLEGLVHSAPGGAMFDRALGSMWKLPTLEEVE